jgi:hypothetical protein
LISICGKTNKYNIIDFKFNKEEKYFLLYYGLQYDSAKLQQNVKLEIIMVLGPNAKILGPRIIQISY